MFDQIIYTRNNFGRQLEKNGIEDKSSGYKRLVYLQRHI